MRKINLLLIAKSEQALLLPRCDRPLLAKFDLTYVDHDIVRVGERRRLWHPKLASVRDRLFPSRGQSAGYAMVLLLAEMDED